MRRPNFKGWVTKELLYLSAENTLNLRRLSFLAQSTVPRLWERLVLYAIATNQVTRLTSFLHREDMIAELATIHKLAEGFDFNDPESNGRLQLPPRYKKALLSYKAAYQNIDTRNASKKLRWEKSVELQKKKGISTTQICEALGLDIGNVTAYLKRSDINRVSLEKATDIMKYLYTVSV